MTIKITDAVHFVKDTSTGALLNTDEQGYRRHKEARARRLSEKQSTDERLTKLEDSVGEILSILRALQNGQK